MPERKIREVIIDIFSLLYAPNPDSPYGLDRADEYRFNRAKYEEKVSIFIKFIISIFFFFYFNCINKS